MFSTFQEELDESNSAIWSFEASPELESCYYQFSTFVEMAWMHGVQKVFRENCVWVHRPLAWRPNDVKDKYTITIIENVLPL